VQQNNSSDLGQLDEKPLALATPDLREEIASIRESLNQTRTEMSLYRRRIERRQLEVDAHIRRTNILWAVVLLAIAGLGTALFFGFHNGALTAPAPQSVSSGAQSRLSPPVERPIEKKDFDNPASEVIQNPTSARTLPAQPSEAKNVNDAIPDTPTQRGGTSIAGPSNTSPKLLADAVNRNRIDFEVSRNKTQEVAPGIFLTVRDTNVERQQINGWLQISQDGKTVWIRDQGAHKAMIFTTKRDERSHELIFTRVGKQGAAGYLLIPASSG